MNRWYNDTGVLLVALLAGAMAMLTIDGAVTKWADVKRVEAWCEGAEGRGHE